MGADLDIPVRIVFDTIRENVKKARAKVKVAIGAPASGSQEGKDKTVASNIGTSKGNDSASKVVHWLVCAVARSVPRTACKLFTFEVLNRSGDGDF
ncbi:hypothetical protein AMTRI_Chr09g37970 [Amborella trichopoda]